MPSPFEAALAKADEAIDAVMAETVTIVPMLRGGASDYGVAVDNERPTIDVRALVNYVDPSMANIDKLEAAVTYNEIEVEILRANLEAGTKFRKGDVVQLIDRPGSPRTKINRVSNIDPTRIVLTLAPISDAD